MKEFTDWERVQDGVCGGWAAVLGLRGGGKTLWLGLFEGTFGGVGMWVFLEVLWLFCRGEVELI